MPQNSPMLYSPINGVKYLLPLPTADRYRHYNPSLTWIKNPWTGQDRAQADITSDPYGHAIVPPGEHLWAAPAGVVALNLLEQTGVNVFDPGRTSPPQVAVENIHVEDHLQTAQALTLARWLLDSTKYADDVPAVVRNHARRVLKIRNQEPE